MFRISLELPRRPFTIKVAMAVEEGSCHCLFGPSAAGKSSILSTAAGFERPRSALIALGETVLERTAAPAVHVPPWKRRLGYLQQAVSLYPHLSVQQNIEYAAPRGLDLDAELRDIVQALGLTDYLSAAPADLSGGLSQRAALARLLASRPRALLLDEPLSRLDRITRDELAEALHTLQRRRGLTMLLVTHQLTEAQQIADAISIIDRGLILQTDPPEKLLARPASRRVAELIGYTHFLPAPGGGFFAVHPDRVLVGAHPQLGPVHGAQAVQVHPHEGGFWASIRLAGGQIIDARLPATEAAGDLTEITLLDPPLVPPKP